VLVSKASSIERDSGPCCAHRGSQPRAGNLSPLQTGAATVVRTPVGVNLPPRLNRKFTSDGDFRNETGVPSQCGTDNRAAIRLSAHDETRDHGRNCCCGFPLSPSANGRPFLFRIVTWEISHVPKPFAIDSHASRRRTSTASPVAPRGDCFGAAGATGVDGGQRVSFCQAWGPPSGR